MILAGMADHEPNKTMVRRNFAKTAAGCGLCMGAGLLVTACQTTQTVHAGIAGPGGKIIIRRDEFAANGSPNMLVKHPKSRFPISLLETEPGKFTACLMSCPHQACETVYTPKDYVCPCHGARFTHYGEVTQGSATKDLMRFPASVSATEIRISVG